jgi:predicted phage terminase large subunit-like protein
MGISVKSVYNSSPQLLAQKCSGGRIIFRPFQIFIAQKIVEAINKGNGRIIISTPPQHGKSEVVSHWIPVWHLSKFPDKHILMFSSEGGLAKRFGRMVRNTVRNNKETLFCELSRDSSSAGRWHTQQGGSMISSSVDGVGVSNPGHLILIDDPYKSWADAMSENTRQKVIDWYINTITQRFQDDTTVIVTHTRWHENDLAGYLSTQDAEKWLCLRIPAIAEENDLIGRKAGEPLLKTKGVKWLETRKKQIGSMAFAAVYQQTPQADKGNIFLREYWQRYTRIAKPKKFKRVIHSWDTAFETKKTAAFSACTVWGETQDKRFYLLEMWRQKADYPTVKNKMIQMHAKYPGSICVLEDKATGKSLRQELEPLGVSIVAVTPVADKQVRCWSVTPIFEGGRVFIAAGEQWADDLIAALASYPSGNWADVADTLSQALAWMAHSNFISLRLVNKLLEAQSGCVRQSQIVSRLSDNSLPYRGVFRFGRNI